MISKDAALSDYYKIEKEQISDIMKVFKAIKILIIIALNIRSNQLGGTKVFDEKYKK